MKWDGLGLNMKRLLKPLIAFLLPLGLVLAVNRLLRAVAAGGHRLQHALQWRIAARQPGWFDHFINQYCWHDSRDSSPWARGTLGLLGMKRGCRLLDLCCGDGFYPYHFYSGRASHILAVDYDPAGIRFAKRNFRTPNLEFLCADIRTQLPRETYDNVTWDAGIDFFSLSDIKLILNGIKERLAPAGLLSGVAPKLSKGQVAHSDQRYEFTSAQGLGELLRQFFGNVAILELADSETSRAALYFYASDGPLPLDADAGMYMRMR